jgi:3-dehydroquinate synthase
MILSKVLRTKKWFIEVDEFDKKERQLLNFGHTFGHALEVASDHAFPHGIAVAIGMKAAIIFERQSREISAVELRLLEYIESLLTVNSQSASPKLHIDWTLFDVAFAGDKKHKPEAYQLVLPNSGGGVRLQMIAKTEESLSLVRSSLKAALEGIVK